MKTKLLFVGLTCTSALLFACGPAPQAEEETCPKGNCTEADINAPEGEQPDDSVPAVPIGPPSVTYTFPAYDAKWELSEAVYEKTQRYYFQNNRDYGHTRYVAIVDFKQHSTKKRFYVFDLATGKVERHATSVGSGSDPDGDGWATSFSNDFNSHQSSLGFYQTLKTYNGKHGYSLRLRGLEFTNSHAEDRAIVIHPADYVDDEPTRAGRSWGCPALDPGISRGVIDKLKNGSLMLITR